MSAQLVFMTGLQDTKEADADLDEGKHDTFEGERQPGAMRRVKQSLNNYSRVESLSVASEEAVLAGARTSEAE